MRAFEVRARGATTACAAPSEGGEGLDAATDRGAPTVLSVSPPAGAAGVTADTAITVVFSEAMDRSSVEGAWPRIYAFRIGDDAADLVGNRLSIAVASWFTTRRRFRIDLPSIDSLTSSLGGNGDVYSGTSVLFTGDTNVNVQLKTFVAFSLPTVPSGGALESAEFVAFQLGTFNSPYLLGTLTAWHVNTATLDPGVFAATPLAHAGTLSSDASLGGKSLDVTAYVDDDLANRAARGSRTQYRLEFVSPTNSNSRADLASLSCSSLTLSLSYLID